MPTSPSNPSADKEDYRLYYQHQYDRMKELEQQRLTMTNVIVGLSILAFSLPFTDITKLNLVNGVGLPIFVFFANTIALLYNRRSRAFIKMHQERAHKALKKFAPEVEELDKEMPKPYKSDEDRFRRPSLQNYLHVLLMIASLIPLGLYFKII